MLLLDLYVDLSLDDVLAHPRRVGESSFSIEIGAALWLALRLVRPADPWLRGERTPDSALAAWRALAGLPLDLLRFGRGMPVVAQHRPDLDLPHARARRPAVLALPGHRGGRRWSSLAYGVFLRFFVIELALRPVLADVSPRRCPTAPTSASARCRCAAAARRPAGHQRHHRRRRRRPGHRRPEPARRSARRARRPRRRVHDLVRALGCCSRARSSGRSRTCARGTERVAAGDLGVRVPVLGTDETGRLAGSFNQMVAGLEERERLREAFGAFVDPQLAERVLEEGTVLEGEEVEVTVLFVDIREFTAFAERAERARGRRRAQRASTSCVVPVLVRHGGHANKFVGDGLLGVFGAPDRLADHADRGGRGGARDRRGRAPRLRRASCGSASASTRARWWPARSAAAGASSSPSSATRSTRPRASRRLTRETGDAVLVTEATCALLQRDHGGFARAPRA